MKFHGQELPPRMDIQDRLNKIFKCLGRLFVNINVEFLQILGSKTMQAIKKFNSKDLVDLLQAMKENLASNIIPNLVFIRQM
jgi:hypothetical protein